MVDLSYIDKFYDKVVRNLPDEELDVIARGPASEGIKDPNSVLRPLGAQMIQREPVNVPDLGIINETPKTEYKATAENYRRNLESAISDTEQDAGKLLARYDKYSKLADESRSKLNNSVSAINYFNPQYQEDPTLAKEIAQAKEKATKSLDLPERDMISELILSLGPAILGGLSGESGQISQKAATTEARNAWESRRKERFEQAKAAKESAQKVYEALTKIKQSSRDSWDKEQQRALDRAKAIKDANVDMFKIDVAQADKYLLEANNLSRDISKMVTTGSKEYADLSNKTLDEANKEVRASILAGQQNQKLSLEERRVLESERANRADEMLKARKIRADEAKAQRQGEHLQLEEKKTVEGLATKNANKVAIKNQIDAVLSQWDSYSQDQKLAQGRQLLKTLNSPEGADAIGAEEANRLGSKLEFALGNFTNSNPTQFGRDLEGFKQQAADTSKNLGIAIDSNRKIIDSVMGGKGIPSGQENLAAPKGTKSLSREEKIKLLKQRGLK